MSRRSMAERLQDGFDSQPLTAHTPAPPPPVTPQRRRRAKVQLVAACVAFAVALFALADFTVDGVWWNVESHAVCTIDSASSHPVYSKSGFLGTDWDLRTSCGRLQVTRDGERFPDSAAQQLARSLYVGSRYRLSLRGWDGWPQGARAIVAATRA